jgi:flagellar hook-length control protein FliK
MSAPALTGILASLGAAPLTSGASATTTQTGPASRTSSRDAARSSFALELQQAQAPVPPPATPPPASTPTPTPTPRPPAPRADAAPAGNAENASSPRASSSPAAPAEDGDAASADNSDVSDPRSTAATARARSRAARDAQRTLPPSAEAQAARAADDVDRNTEAAAGAQRGRKAARTAGDDSVALPLPPSAPALPTTSLAANAVPAATPGCAPSPEAAAAHALADAADAADAADPAPASNLDTQDPSRPSLQGARVRIADDEPARAAKPRPALAPGEPAPGPAAAETRPPPTTLPPGDVTTAVSALQATRAERLGTPEATSGSTPTLPSFAADMARAMAPAGTSPAAATHPAATVLNLPTPVNTAEFVPRLSGELAVLARDGVQEARINVHPVELGPISVQIALDGTAAQVHLAVDNAQTRELLEQAMPSLAAALRETGLTLTGGGVFQQARQNAQDGGREGTPAGSADARQGQGRAGNGDADGVLPTAAPSRLRAVGALDVYA